MHRHQRGRQWEKINIDWGSKRSSTSAQSDQSVSVLRVFQPALCWGDFLGWKVFI